MRTRGAGRQLDPRSFEQALAGLLSELRAKRYSSSVLAHAARELPHFFSFLRQQRVADLRQVSEAHVFAWAKLLGQRQSPQGAPLAAETQRGYLLQVKRLFAFLVRRGVVLLDPALDLDMPRVSKLPRTVLTEAQARRLMSASDGSTAVGLRNRALLETLYGTGLRVSECAQLELRDLDLGRGTLFVRRGKGRKDRVVPIAGQAVEALTRYLREGRPELLRDARQQALFLSSLPRPGRPMRGDSLTLIVRQAARAAGLGARVTSHTLRHTYATHLLRGGADVRHVQRLLGHADLRSTAIYTRVLPADLAEVVRRAHPRERSWARRKKGRERRRRRQ